MKRKILLVYLLSILGVNAQIKNVSIISTNNFNSSDSKQLQEVISLLNGNKNASKYNFSFESLISDEGKINITQNFDFNSIENTNENKKFETPQLEIEELNSHNKSQVIQFNQNSILKFECENNAANVKELVKLIKKIKSNNVIIIWNNSFKPFIFSFENIIRFIKDNMKKKPNPLVPIITVPNKTHPIIRPDESHYYIEFDSVGIFPSYQIEIFKLSIKLDVDNKTIYDINDKPIYDSTLLLKECLSFTTIPEFKNRKKTEKIALFSEYDSKCKIAILVDYIAGLVYQSEKSIRTEDVKDDEEGCDDCRYKILYKKKFSVRIKGCAPGIDEDQVPYGYPNTRNFLFQCTIK